MVDGHQVLFVFGFSLLCKFAVSSSPSNIRLAVKLLFQCLLAGYLTFLYAVFAEVLFEIFFLKKTQPLVEDGFVSASDSSFL